MDKTKTKAERREMILAAAAERLKSAQFEWLKGLTFDHLSNDTGIDRSQIASDFGNKAKLSEALVEYCLQPGTLDDPWPEDLADAAGELLLNPDVPLEEAMAAIGDFDDEFHATDSSFAVQMAIWALARHDPAANRKLDELYEFFDEGHVVAWDRFRSMLEEADVHQKTGVKTEDLMAILTALAEGMAIRASVHPDLAAKRLTALGMQLLAEGALQAPGARAALGDLMREIDAATLPVREQRQPSASGEGDLPH